MEGIFPISLNPYLASLADVSYSDDTKRSIVNDTRIVIDLDKFATSKKKLCGSEQMASFDAFHIDKANKQYLLEFKDQPPKNINSNEIQKKVVCSTALLLLFYQQDTTYKEFSANTSLFVIFKDDENENSFYRLPSEMKKWIEPNPAKREEPLLFEFSSEYKSSFKEIHTIPESIFKKDYFPYIFE
ncbi:MAG: hypothetical protein PHH86_10055 [Sphaerochaetaceae bacterium]|nr:hypothetical protein [Sphaerochaetaceae bacterium]